MSLVFEFDAASWERAEWRHAVRTLATLLPWPSRLGPGAHGTADDVVVAVGDAAGARADAALVLRTGAWTPWPAGTLRAFAWNGRTLLAPGEGALAIAAGRELPAAWLRTIAHLLQREEETLEGHRDEWENFSGFYSRLHELGLLERPLVDELAASLAARLRETLAARGRSLPESPRWKDGAPFAAALSHDVDWVRLHSRDDALRLLGRARGLRSYAFRAGLAQLAGSLRAGDDSDPYWNFDRWAAEESARGFRSTFYFCPFEPARPHEYDATYQPADAMRWRGERTTVSGMMRALAAEGFEVGLHGSYQSHRDADELARQRAQIERAVGAPVTGIRQHFLRFDVRVTWAAQQAAGFRYDTSLGYNEALGFRGGVAVPYRAWDAGGARALELLAVPLTVMDGALFRTLKLDAGLAARRVRAHLDAVQGVCGLAGLLWHPNAADEAHFPGWWRCYLDVLDELRARGAWVTSVGEIAAWWAEREARHVTVAG